MMLEATALEKYKRDDDIALATLKEALGALQTDLSKQQSTLNKLSLAVARQALSNVFGPTSSYDEQIRETISKLLSNCRDNLVVSVSLSKADFPDRDALMTSQGNVDTGKFDLQIRADLPAGHAKIKLRLGDIDISLPDYWLELEHFFETAQAQMGDTM